MEKRENIIISKKLIKRLLIAAFCLFVAMSTAYVMFFEYEPSHNALGALSTVSMDIICMMILLILVGSFAFANYAGNQTTRIFTVLLLATIWSMFLDLLNWAFDGELSFDNITCWFTIGSLCMGSMLAAVFSLYLYSYMSEMHGLKHMKMSARVCIILNMFSFALAFVLAITRTAFEFVDGHYEVATLYEMVTVIPILTLLYMVGYSIRYAKVVGLHDIVAVTGYILFMVFGALVETVYRVGTTYIGVAIADIFIFVLLQNEIIAREKRNVEKWIRKSNTDELTGCYNRHAYEDDMERLEQGGPADNFVYVSIDVNELKNMNDSLGHSAGDELIVGAADCLKKCFGPYGRVYRTGGDEFAAILFVDADQLTILRRMVVEITEAWHGKSAEHLTMSCGYVARTEDKQLSARQMAIVADKRMYEDKANYYKMAGHERRKQ